MVVVFSKIYPACQTDENGIKPGSYLNNADKHVAESSGAECLRVTYEGRSEKRIKMLYKFASTD